MRILTVLRKSAQVYLKNFTDLMGAYLVEALLRAMCFVPLMFLLLPETAVWALLCVPMYVFIALPARQNYAIAMQDMLYGGRVFSPRLISFDGYWRKLGRGLAGTLKMLLWMALPLLLVTLLVQLYKGEGWLCAVVLRYHKLMQVEGFAFADLFRPMEAEAYTRIIAGWLTDLAAWEPKGGETLLPIMEVLSFDLSDKLGKNGFFVMSWFGSFGHDTISGVVNLMLVVVATFLLPVIGCAVHCGNRHASALEDRKLLRGKRLKLMGLWALGFLVFLPFAAVVLTTLMSDLKAFVLGFAEMFLTKNLSIPALGEKLYIILAAFVLLCVTLVPFKQLLPAVAAHEQMKAAYPQLQANEENSDAQA